MSNRREFFKVAGAVAGLPLAKISVAHAETHTTASPEKGLTREIVIENAEMRLRIAEDGRALSLIHRQSGQECLVRGADVSAFSVTQYRPYDNELQLSYPAEVTVFPATNVRREGDQLVIKFGLVDYEATLGLRITNAYIAFKILDLTYTGSSVLRPKRKTPIDEMVLLQLPVRQRRNFGDWLNVMWDEDVAVSLLAAGPQTRIIAKPCANYCLFQASAVDAVKTEGVSAALITTSRRNVLDRIASLEADFDLPRGVESRRRKEYKWSYYEAGDLNPQNIDRHLAFAKKGGFRLLSVYYMSFAKTSGHYSWRPEYPNGIEDLQAVVRKIKAGGLLPGLHFHYNKAHKQDAYVTPEPDPRLNLRRLFTLAAPLDETATTLTVEENPRRCTLDNDRRILRIENELISYSEYTTQAPYRFAGCKRGDLGTQPGSYVEGTRFGLLDVDTWPVFVRFTQNTSIQQEAAKCLAGIYNQAGFEFAYYDGAEDVPPPYWFTVSRSQWVVNQAFDPKPLFAEGACKSHFSWHILTRGNAFDTFEPEQMKEAIRTFPGREAPRVARDFTSINFGWIGYWAPNSHTIGTQPDMLEYVTSRAAAWDCPVALRGDLEQLQAHPRTPDNLEVLRRWEEVRARNWLASAQKRALRNLQQEHILLVNEGGNFELIPYKEIPNVAGGNRAARAFLFERLKRIYAVYWHTSGTAELALPISGHSVRLMEEIGRPMHFKSGAKGVHLPLAGRLYVEISGLTQAEVVKAFQEAVVVS